MIGAGKIDTKRLFAEVQANVAKLDACPRHFFPLSEEDVLKGSGFLIGQKPTCERCGGQLRLTDVAQYIKGYAAAGGNPNDIMPGYNEESEGHGERRYFGEDRAD